MTSRNVGTARKAKERDGYECQKCGRSSSSSLQAHHITPLSMGGSDSVENIATLCAHCHRYAPEIGLSKLWYTTVFTDYVSTGTRPEVDFLWFGSQISSNPVYDNFQVQRFFEIVIRALRDLPEHREVTKPEFYWLSSAALADYGRVREATGIDKKLANWD